MRKYRGKLYEGGYYATTHVPYVKVSWNITKKDWDWKSVARKEGSLSSIMFDEFSLMKAVWALTKEVRMGEEMLRTVITRRVTEEEVGLYMLGH